jgi:hypothetical protein
MKKSQRSALRLLAVTTLVVIASAGTAVTAQAAYIVNATETGGDVVFAGSGSLNTSTWTLSSGTHSQASAVAPDAVISVGPTVISGLDRYITPTNFAGPTLFGSGTALTFSTAGTGDYTALWFNDDPQNLYLPSGYVTGAALAGTATYVSATFAGLGLTPGTYEWTWGSGVSADSLTLNVGAVPIPAAVWLFGSGLLGLIGMARRKKVA